MNKTIQLGKEVRFSDDQLNIVSKGPFLQKELIMVAGGGQVTSMF